MKTALLFATALLLAVVAVPQVEAARPKHRDGAAKHHQRQDSARHCRHGHCKRILGRRK